MNTAFKIWIEQVQRKLQRFYSTGSSEKPTTGLLFFKGGVVPPSPKHD